MSKGGSDGGGPPSSVKHDAAPDSAPGLSPSSSSSLASPSLTSSSLPTASGAAMTLVVPTQDSAYVDEAGNEDVPKKSGARSPTSRRDQQQLQQLQQQQQQQQLRSPLAAVAHNGRPSSARYESLSLSDDAPGSVGAQARSSAANSGLRSSSSVTNAVAPSSSQTVLSTAAGKASLQSASRQLGAPVSSVRAASSSCLSGGSARAFPGLAAVQLGELASAVIFSEMTDSDPIDVVFDGLEYESHRWVLRFPGTHIKRSVRACSIARLIIRACMIVEHEYAYLETLGFGPDAETRGGRRRSHQVRSGTKNHLEMDPIAYAVLMFEAQGMPFVRKRAMLLSEKQAKYIVSSFVTQILLTHSTLMMSIDLAELLMKAVDTGSATINSVLMIFLRWILLAPEDFVQSRELNRFVIRHVIPRMPRFRGISFRQIYEETVSEVSIFLESLTRHITAAADAIHNPLKADPKQLSKVSLSVSAADDSALALLSRERSTEQVAQLLTSYLWRYFAAMQPGDLFPRVDRHGVLRKESGPGVRKFVDISNRITRWIAASVLLTSVRADRLDLMTRMVEVATHLLSMRCYAGATVVAAALLNSSVSRISETYAWAAETRTRLDRLTRVFDPAKNFAAYRTLLAESSLPTFPHIIPFVSDAVYVTDGNPRFFVDPKMPVGFLVPDEPTVATGLINFEKLTMYSQLGAQLRHFQSLDFGFPNDDAYFDKVLYLREFSDEDLWNLSLTIKPSTLTLDD
jgi:hypothetical protein